MKNLTKYWWLLLLGGIAYVVLGALVMQYPDTAILGAAYYIGFSLLFIGISQTLFGFMGNGSGNGSWFSLIMGILDVALGVYLLSNPIASAETLVLLIGFWILYKGIITTINSFELKKSSHKLWWLNSLGGIILIALGWTAAGDPVSGGVVTVVYLSISFYVKGIVMIANSLTIGSSTSEDS